MYFPCSTSIDVGAAELESDLNSASAGALAEAGIPSVAADWTLMMRLNGALNQQLSFAVQKSIIHAEGALKEAGIPFVPADSTMMMWLDLRKFLTEPTWEGERALWHRLADEQHVILTPGKCARLRRAQSRAAAICIHGLHMDYSRLCVRAHTASCR